MRDCAAGDRGEWQYQAERRLSVAGSDGRMGRHRAGAFDLYGPGGRATAVVGNREHQLKVFAKTQFQITSRIRLFLGLPIEKIDRMSLQTRLRDLGQQRTE